MIINNFTIIKILLVMLYNIVVSAYNRYKFTKNVYHNHIVLLYKKNRYYTYGIDKKILEYIKFNNEPYMLRKYRINYLVLDELDIIENYEYMDNQIARYIYLLYINKIMNEVKVVMSYKYDLL